MKHEICYGPFQKFYQNVLANVIIYELCDQHASALYSETMALTAFSKESKTWPTFFYEGKDFCVVIDNNINRIMWL